MSLIASCAELQILLIALLAVEDENSRLELRALLTGNREGLIVFEFLCNSWKRERTQNSQR